LTDIGKSKAFELTSQFETKSQAEYGTEYVNQRDLYKKHVSDLSFNVYRSQTSWMVTTVPPAQRCPSSRKTVKTKDYSNGPRV
jgi:hypothetical protein